MAEKQKLDGSFGAPPDDAPREVTQPIDSDAMAARMAEAQRINLERTGSATAERTPFNPDPAKQVQPAAQTENAATTALLEAARARRTETVSHQPAASETDSPKRGFPKFIDDPGKKITGGFGSIGDTEYYPIDGHELQTIVEALAARLVSRIKDDLRFSKILVYPRLNLQLTLATRCFVEKMNFDITYVAAKEQTPLEVAEARADEVVFVVKEVRREFDEQGESEHPANWMREEVGLQVPGKQFVGTGQRRTLVDVVTDTKDMF